MRWFFKRHGDATVVKSSGYVQLSHWRMPKNFNIQAISQLVVTFTMIQIRYKGYEDVFSGLILLCFEGAGSIKGHQHTTAMRDLDGWEELRSVSGSPVYPPNCVILTSSTCLILLLSKSTDSQHMIVQTNDLNK